MESRFQHWSFLRRADLQPGEHPLPSASAASRLDRWLADPSRRLEALRLYESLVGRPARRGELTLRDLHRFVKPRLERAFRSGEMVAIPGHTLPRKRERTHAWSAVEVEKPVERAAAPSRPSKPAAAPKTWVGVRLVGMTGEGVAGMRYSIKLADGSTREGRTGADGGARIEDLEEGQVEVSFPDLDKDAWELA